MRRPAGASPDDDGAVYFGPNVCCTYHPSIPSFIAGAILVEASADLAFARREIEQRIAARVEVSPRGIGPLEAFWPLYGALPFGSNEVIRCPYLDPAGLCGMWRKRNSVCTTWFCKHERGAVGHAFWSALQRLAAALEEAVACHCAVVLDLGGDALAAWQAPPAEKPGEVERARARAWGRWHGRERDYFLACAEVVARLSPAEVLALGGAEATLHARVLRQAEAACRSRAVPAAGVRLGSFTVTGSPGEQTRVATYSPYDPLDVPRPLLSALARFDGRPTAEVVAEVDRCDHLQLSPELLRMLLDYRVLEERR